MIPMAQIENQEIPEENIIVLFDEEENKDIECEWLDSVEYEGKQYAVVLPLENEDGTVLIMEMVPDDDSDDEESWLFNGVEDAEVLNTVYSIFKENNKDEFDFQ